MIPASKVYTAFVMTTTISLVSASVGITTDLLRTLDGRIGVGNRVPHLH